MPRVLFLTALIVAASLAPMLEAASPLPETSRGITADGRTITARWGVRPPWARDIIHSVIPTYPPSLYARHPTAAGYFRVVLNVRTGRVRAVVIDRSTGYKAIDGNIVAALRRWQLKPNRWREFEIHVKIAYEPASG